MAGTGAVDLHVEFAECKLPENENPLINLLSCNEAVDQISRDLLGRLHNSRRPLFVGDVGIVTTKHLATFRDPTPIF